MIKCPRTGEPMLEVEIDGVVVDVSTGCGGVWFDTMEVKKFDEQHEDAGEELIRLMEQYHKDFPNEEQRLRCPRGCDAVMMRRFFSPKRNVELDECPGCGGIWLDPGELAMIRTLFKTEAQRQEAGRAFVQELAQEAGLKDRDEHKRIKGMFTWMIPGLR